MVPAGTPWCEYGARGAGGLLIVHGRGHAWVSGGGNATASGGGDATASGGGNATAHGGGDATASGGGNARAHDGGDATASGGGNARALGGGDATAHGGGDATAYDGGVETDHRGTRWPVESIGIGYECLAGGGWLRVGCEIHSLDVWLRDAEEIDARHGDGIAALTRALAERLLAGVAP